jgi:DNA mismatch endonuclease (patch repair protein)
MARRASDPRPPPLDSATRRRMERQKRRDTVPEMLLRRELHARGLRYRTAVQGLPGRPDLVFSRARIAVFVDGCFWHRCPQHGTVPRNNRDWWLAKLDANVERDHRQVDELETAGWTVLRFWEHDDVGAAADAVQRLWTAHRSRWRRGAVGVPGVEPSGVADKVRGTVPPARPHPASPGRTHG